MLQVALFLTLSLSLSLSVTLRDKLRWGVMSDRPMTARAGKTLTTCQSLRILCASPSANCSIRMPTKARTSRRSTPLSRTAWERPCRLRGTRRIIASSEACSCDSGGIVLARALLRTMVFASKNLSLLACTAKPRTMGMNQVWLNRRRARRVRAHRNRFQSTYSDYTIIFLFHFLQKLK